MTAGPDRRSAARRRRVPMVLVGVGGTALAAIVAAAIGSSQEWGQDPSSPPAATAPPADNAPAPPSEDEDEHDDHTEHNHGHDSEGASPNWQGVTYQDLHGAQLPVSPVHGPRSVTAGEATGFARDEGGAALAAVHLATRVGPQVGPDVYGPAIERMVGDVSAMMAQVDAEYAAARAASGLPDSEPLRIYGQTIGYAMPLPPGPDTEEVTVHLLGRGAGEDGGEVLVTIPVTLVWTEEDWRLVVPPGARWSGQPVAGSTGYTLFPGDED